MCWRLACCRPSYVATLGSLTGLTTTGNTGAGSTPTISVTYGSAASTAAQGNTALSFTGAGNLTGSLSGTAGGGFTTTTLTVINNPTFSGLVTANGGLSVVGTTTINTTGTATTTIGNAVGGVTISSLAAAGIVQSSPVGLLSTGAVDRNSATLLTGTLSAANGGTGQSAYAIGDLLYASGATALSKLNSGARHFAGYLFGAV